jgi:hypothetical protein
MRHRSLRLTLIVLALVALATATYALTRPGEHCYAGGRIDSTGHHTTRTCYAPPPAD